MGTGSNLKFDKVHMLCQSINIKSSSTALFQKVLIHHVKSTDWTLEKSDALVTKAQSLKKISLYSFVRQRALEYNNQCKNPVTATFCIA